MKGPNKRKEEPSLALFFPLVCLVIETVNG